MIRRKNTVKKCGTTVDAANKHDMKMTRSSYKA
jgi:hypothetical protein